MPYKSLVKRNEYQKLWRSNRRKAWMKGKCCVVCGSTRQLELDHIDPKQKLDHRIWSWSVQRFTSEVSKCQVLCRKHHIEKTWSDKKRAVHGTNSMYTSQYCRCQPCRNAHAIMNKKYRQCG